MSIPAWPLALVFGLALSACGGAEGGGCGGPAEGAGGDDENWHNCPAGSEPKLAEPANHLQPYQCVRSNGTVAR